MPTIFVYALSDFTTSIPNEAGAIAAGNPPFTITTGSTLTRIEIELTDNDANFDEIDTSQTLTNTVVIDGVTYTAGSRVFGNYTLTNGTDPDLISVTIGGSNTGSNTTSLVATLVPLEPNTTYVYDEELNYNGNSEPYTGFVCFTSGTRILTPSGLRLIDELKVGDLVFTRDAGMQPIKWISRRRLGTSELHRNVKSRPVIISKDAFGLGCPDKDIAVSPQHRILQRGAAASLLFGETEVLAPAKGLINGSSVRRDDSLLPTGYIHILLEHHELVLTEGLWSESFHPESMALELVGDKERSILFDAMPQLSAGPNWYGTTARMTVSVRQSALLR